MNLTKEWKWRCLRSGHTLKELAGIAGVSPQTLTHAMKGKHGTRYRTVYAVEETLKAWDA